MKILNRYTRTLISIFLYKRHGAYLVLLFVLIGFSVSVEKIFGESPDYLQYDIFFSLVRNQGINIVYQSRFEVGFLLLAIFFTTTSISNQLVYGWFVVVAMLLKGFTIYSYSSSRRIFIIVSIFYLTRYFPLHELTQLRAACSFGLLLIAATFLWKENKPSFIIFSVLAVMFHMSAAIAIPLLFLKSNKRWVVLIIGFGVFALTSLIAKIIFDYFANYFTIIAAYQAVNYGEWQLVRAFAITVVLDWVMILGSLIIWTRITFFMKQVVILQIIGMAIFYALLDLPVFASRMREVFSVFWLIFVADGLRYKYTRAFTLYFVIVTVLVYCYIYFIKGDFFT